MGLERRHRVRVKSRQISAQHEVITLESAEENADALFWSESSSNHTDRSKNASRFPLVVSRFFVVEAVCGFSSMLNMWCEFSWSFVTV